ncbi:hypothetical protein M947_10635 [Sulfurimonas hongkongensis]|uniref:Glycoside hydrolase n=1 Tax=Sulfurimonas hongkongensis TaxID=1172190 RepID=T0KCK2_9BACT|nr:SH3 domain-containing protein [Sulfurimonas hongkongensis]EQB34454.1 hypothetical protein M947_10635 [Sulfurimonas hongkongensis]
MRYIVLVIVSLFFISCATKESTLVKSEKKSKKNIEIYEVSNIPQDVEFFTKNAPKDREKESVQSQYEKYYFSVWNYEKPRASLESIKWPLRVYGVKNSYAENFHPISQEFFDEMQENSNFDEYGSLNANAITLRHVDMRIFPTSKPLLKDPNLAGEGFPFDYLQNSTLGANKPLFVSHYSKDREWLYAFSSFASGWIRSSEVVFLNKKHTDAWQKAQQIFFIKDKQAIYDSEGNFLFSSKLGTLLALISEEEDYFIALAISSYKNSKPLFERVKISKTIAKKEVLDLDRDSLRAVMSEVFKDNYGWGGMYGQRDCSSMLRDMFAPFGIWLPRNSKEQARIGEVISLENLSDDEKIYTIIEKAIPFETLLYISGHIVLYVGLFDDEIIVFHNTWGVKTIEDGVKGRAVIGKTIFSTLEFGNDLPNYDKESSILRNLKSMNILTR